MSQQPDTDENAAVEPGGDRDAPPAEQPPAEDAPPAEPPPDEEPAPTEPSSGPSLSADEELVFKPAISVVVIQLGLVAGVGTAVIGLFAMNPEIVGGGELAEVIIAVLAFVFGIVVLRLLIRLVVLRRTEYVVGTDRLRREYHLLYKTSVREVPLAKLRGMEFTQGRIEALLDYGTITFLTAGMNQSLGFLKFSNIRYPEDARAEVRELIRHR